MLTASRKSVGVDGAMQRCGEDHAGREPAEDEETAGGGSSRSGAGQQENGAQRQPGHIDDGAEGEEQTERHSAPAMALRPPKREGSDQKEPHGDGPGQFMGPATAKPAIKGAETECQGNDGGGGGQSRVEGHAGQG